MKYYSKYWNRQLKLRRHWADLTLIWIFSIILMAFLTDKLKTPERFISPIADKTFAHEYVFPTPTSTVPTDEEIFTYAVKVWGKEGKHILIKMFNCFYSESGWRYDAIGVNKNGTRDVGLAQVNDIHGMSLEDRLDYKKNIDKAYQIYLGRGKNFSAWYGSLCK